jgi:hypothetical protein
MMDDNRDGRKFPIRSHQHVTEDVSLSILRDILPRQWIMRPGEKDYGLDGEIEIIFEDCLVKGNVFRFQAKGHDKVSSTRDCISEQIDISTIHYWLEFPLPVILFVIDISQRVIYWLDVKDYIKQTSSKTDSKLRSQKTLNLIIPKSNILPDTLQDIVGIVLSHKEMIADFQKQEENGVIADFIGYHILVQLFDGDLDAYETYLREKGSDRQIIEDFPFLVWLKERVKEDSDLMNRIKRMVDETKGPLADGLL